MKGLNFTKQTSMIALVFFTLYFIYGMFHLPFTRYLVSLAVGGISYGISGSYEIAVISLFVMNFFFPLFGGPGVKEGFVSKPAKKEKVEKKNDMTKDVTKGIMLANTVQLAKGVGSKMTEGFADAKDEDMTIDTKKKESENSKDATAASKPAKAEEEEDITGSEEEEKPKDKKESFENNGAEFKLGHIPSDKKGGYHVDVGTTMMNALKALKPDQIKAMTSDTKQLLETQKSLMSMLKTFQPMVQEGQQMMTTFQSMFSPTAGAS
jgi:hypothetical protein